MSRVKSKAKVSQSKMTQAHRDYQMFKNLRTALARKKLKNIKEQNISYKEQKAKTDVFILR